MQETHVFSPRVVNTFTLASRALLSLTTPRPMSRFPSKPFDFVQGRGPGGITISGGLTTTGSGGVVTAAGPNNASSVWNRRNLFTYADNLQISKGIHQISLGVSLQRLQDNEDTASRLLGQASFLTLQSFLQGTVSTLASRAPVRRVGLAKPDRRMVRARRYQAAAQSHG